MKYRSHVIAGLSGGILLNQLLILPNHSANLIQTVILLSGSVVGSLLPDLDHQGSFLGRKAKPLSILLQSTVGHRGIIHSPLFNAIILVVLFFLGNELDPQSLSIFNFLLLGLAIGIFVGHLFMDFLTIGGIPLFYPFSKANFHLLPIRTGGIFESIITLGIIAFTTYILAIRLF